jgi:hypothetical protein
MVRYVGYFDLFKAVGTRGERLVFNVLSQYGRETSVVDATQ